MHDTSDTEFNEPAAELITKAISAGFRNITPRKLARWHQEGLLPKPIQRPLGRGKGTATFYPKGTSQQLIALCSFHQKTRNFNELGWRLWWAGFEVEQKYWVKRLRSRAKWYDRVIAFVKKWGFDKESEFAYLSDRSMELFEQNTHKRSALPFWRRMRKYIGKKSLDVFGKYIFQIMVGKFQSKAIDNYHDDGEKNTDASILLKGLGLRKRKRLPSNKIELNHVLQQLEKLSRSLDIHTLSNAAESTPSEIRAAQKELLTVTSLILHGSHIIQRLGIEPDGLKIMENIFRSNDINLQGLLLLGFIILKKDASKNDEIRNFINNPA